MRTLTKDTPQKIGESVTLMGWIHSRRDHGRVIFIDLRDRLGMVQVVFLPLNAGVFGEAEKLRQEWVVRVEGKVKERPEGMRNPELETGGIEIEATGLEILSRAEEPPMPVAEKAAEETDLQKRLDWRWLDLRKPEKLLIFQVWTAMEDAFREYWIKNGYLEIHSPKLMGAPSESGAEVFEVKYFDEKAYLAQSPQFYKQMAMAAGFERVFEVGPVFRAEPSFTAQHATEFTGYDAEISFINSHDDVMAELEGVFGFVLKKLKDDFGTAIKKYYDRDAGVPLIPFPRRTMKEAKDILAKLQVPRDNENDLSPEEERRLSEFIKEKEDHEFVFVTDYPATVRPFYHMRSESDPSLTKSFDLLWNGIEIATGAQREHRYETLVAQAREKGLRLEPIQFYLDFFKYGCPPHGGFGLGPSRMLMKLLNVSNLREVMYLYRGVKRLTP